MPRLVIHPGKPQSWEIKLKPGVNYLGRAFSNDFKIEEPSVSSAHCQIMISEGWAMIKDLGSTNGTFVNRAPIQEAQLQPGQTIHLGGVEMFFDDDAPALATATSVAPISIAAAPPAPAPAAPPIPPPIPDGTVRMARPQAPPPAMSGSAVVVPPPAPAQAVASAPVAASKPAVCRYHPHDPARWLCGKCRKTFCDLCVAARRDGEEMKHYCRTCGVECSEMEIKVVIEEEKSFFQVLPGAFAYPFRKEGILIFIVVGILLVGLDFLASISKYANAGGGGFLLKPYAFTAMLIRLVFWGYLFAYMQNIIQSTASGDQSPPEMPAMSEFFSDIIVPFFQLAVIFAVCFGAAVMLTIWGATGETAAIWAVIPLIGLGCLYFPMAFLAVAMYDTVAAVNPLLVIPSILKVPLQYVVVCVVFGAILVFRWLFGVVLSTIIPIAVIPVVISSFLGLYLLTVEMRILGLLYLTNKRNFAWFKR